MEKNKNLSIRYKIRISDRVNQSPFLSSTLDKTTWLYIHVHKYKYTCIRIQWMYTLVYITYLWLIIPLLTNQQGALMDRVPPDMLDWTTSLSFATQSTCLDWLRCTCRRFVRRTHHREPRPCGGARGTKLSCCRGRLVPSLQGAILFRCEAELCGGGCRVLLVCTRTQQSGVGALLSFLSRDESSQYLLKLFMERRQRTFEDRRRDYPDFANPIYLGQWLEIAGDGRREDEGRVLIFHEERGQDGTRRFHLPHLFASTVQNAPANFIAWIEEEEEVCSSTN